MTTTTTTTNSNTIVAGCTVRVSKGCKSFGITKGTLFTVVDVQPMGAEYGHQVKVSFKVKMGAGLYGREFFCLYARHINRLSDSFTRFNNGDPTNYMEVVFKAPPVV